MSQQQLPAAVASLQSGDITVADFAAATSTAALTEAAPTVVVQPAERDELVDLRGRWCEPPCHTTAREL